MEDQASVFVSLSDRVVQLHSQAPSSLFFAFYNSQGYGGSILTRPHTGKINAISPMSLESYLNMFRYAVWLELLILPYYVLTRQPPIVSETIAAVTMKNAVFWDVAPSGSCKIRRFFREEEIRLLATV
jgi:hypothetical protein